MAASDNAATWRKLADSGPAKAATVAVLAIAILYVHGTWDEPAAPAPAPVPVRASATPPQVIRSFDGVQLGGKLADAAKARGPFVRQGDDPHRVKKYADEEEHFQKNGRLQLAVRAGTIFSIAYPCMEGRDPAAVNQVACHEPAERIREVFGNRVRVLCPKVKPDNPNAKLAPFARAHDAVEFGVRYIAVRDQVTGFIIADPAELASMVGFNWVQCP
jgi:hypothetical protein